MYHICKYVDLYASHDFIIKNTFQLVVGEKKGPFCCFVVQARPNFIYRKVASVSTSGRPVDPARFPCTRWINIDVPDQVYINISKKIDAVEEEDREYFHGFRDIAGVGYRFFSCFCNYFALRTMRAWRHLLSECCPKSSVRKLLAACESALNKEFGQPMWSIQLLDSEEHVDNIGMFVQVYSEDGRQPVHFDNGSHWISSGGKQLPTLACVLMLDDGYGPFLFGPPQDDMFPSLARSGTPEQFFASVKAFVERGDAEFKQPDLCRAGQLVCFHPGEQAHCGVGHGGFVSRLTGSTSRKTLFFLAVPQPLVTLLVRHPIFGTEGQTWGLLKEGWSVDRVKKKFFFFLCFVFVMCAYMTQT
jgi:hypothetical protein